MFLSGLFIKRSKDNDGFITKEELENIMGGVIMDEDTWKAILQESDNNQDGRVNKNINLIIRRFL